MKQRDNLTDRLARKYAVIYLTIQMMNKCFDLKLSAANLLKLLLEPEQRSVCERDIAVKGLEAIKNFVVSKLTNFDINDRTGEMLSRLATGNRYGAVVIDDDGFCNIYMPTANVEMVLKQNNINEIATVKKRWKESGKTVCDNGRNDCKYNGLRSVHFKLDMNVGEIGFGIECHTKCNDNKTHATTQMPCPAYSVEYDDNELVEEIFTDEATTY